MGIEFINLCPHGITIKGNPGLFLEKAIRPLRVVEEPLFDDEVEGLLISTKAVKGLSFRLPAESAGTYYIVPSIVAAFLVFRSDILVPQGLIIRNGEVIGAKSLSRWIKK